MIAARAPGQRHSPIIFGVMNKKTRYLQIILFGIGFMTAGCAVYPRVAFADQDTPARSIYLVNHGWHAGIVVRRGDIPMGVWPAHEDFPDSTYLEVGWGDSEFYQTPEPDLLTTLQAGLAPTESVLHIVGFDSPVTRYFPYSEVVGIRISEMELERLCRYFNDSHQRDKMGNRILLGPGLYGKSRFYRSGEEYHLFNNSNHWTARALQTAGCRTGTEPLLTVDQLMNRGLQCGIRIQSGKDD